jgi:uncharacterized protein YggE
MQETVITVRGEYSRSYPAERATVHVDVAFDGPDRTAAFEATTTAAAGVREAIEPLHDSTNGAITHWDSEAVTVWTERPWAQDGSQLPPVFHARISFTITFADFAALSRWIETSAVRDGVSVTAIDWSLTEGRTTTVTAEVRSRAVKDAVAKASVYAQSIGLGTVRAIAVADPGMLGDQTASSAAPSLAKASMMRADAPAELSLRPRDIEVSAVVDARFIAS